MKLINADKLITFIQNARKDLMRIDREKQMYSPLEFSIRDNMLLNFEQMVRLIPEVNLEDGKRPKGKWVNDKDDLPRCDQCNYLPEFNRHIDDYYYSDYCPNCGAIMRGDKNDSKRT